MLGKFVDTLTQIQNQCRGQPAYQFQENIQIGQLFDVQVMDYDVRSLSHAILLAIHNFFLMLTNIQMQQDRLGPPPEDDLSLYSATLPPILASDHQGSRDTSVIKRLFFNWSNSS